MKNTFGQRLKELRKKKNMTQQELSKILNVGRPTIAGYETKGVEPSYEKLIKIADYFDVSIDYLAGRVNTVKISNDCNESSEAVELLEEITALSIESRKDLKMIIELFRLRDEKIKL